MSLRTRLLIVLLSLLLLAALAAPQKKGGGLGGDIHVLLPDPAFSGGLITGVVLGEDDKPVPNAPVTLDGGFPAVLSGEVIGDDNDKTAMKTPGPPQTGKPAGIIGPSMDTANSPRDCGRLIQQAQGIVAGNQGSDHILIGLLVPAVSKLTEVVDPSAAGTGTVRPAETVREAANSPASEAREAATQPGGIIAPTDSRSGGGIWLKANGGGLFTDANGRFALCAAPGAQKANIAMGDGSVRSLTLNAMPDNGCAENGMPGNDMPDNGVPANGFFTQPNAELNFSKLMTNAVVVQGVRQWRLPMARAYSPNGQCVRTALKMPRDLGPGQAQFSFFDRDGKQQSFTGGVFKIVNAQIDRDKLRSHQDAGFEYELAFAGFGPEYGQNQFGPEYGHQQLCVNVATSGPVTLTSPGSQPLHVNGDGHATVKGKIRATQVAPGSTVPFGIKLNVLDCATGHH